MKKFFRSTIPPSTATTQESRPLKFLIIDDNEVNRFTLHKMLRQIFPQTIIQDAANGRAGWELFQEEEPPFDIVITDIDMPILDGIGFINLVYQQSEDKPQFQVPIIAITSDTKSYTEAALDAGADQVLSKPIKIDLLKVNINRLLETYSSEHSVSREKKDPDKPCCFRPCALF